MLMVALSFIGIQKFVFLFHDYGKLPLDHWYCNSRFSFVAVILHGLILILSLPFFFSEDFVFSTTDLSDVPQYVTQMWKGMIKLPTTIDSVLFVTLV